MQTARGERGRSINHINWLCADSFVKVEFFVSKPFLLPFLFNFSRFIVFGQRFKPSNSPYSNTQCLYKMLQEETEYSLGYNEVYLTQRSLSIPVPQNYNFIISLLLVSVRFYGKIKFKGEILEKGLGVLLEFFAFAFAWRLFFLLLFLWL